MAVFVAGMVGLGMLVARTWPAGRSSVS
jgi:hypothetical protein